MFLQPIFLASALPLSGFASVFEVFTGIGFAFFGLTEIDNLLRGILDMDSRESDKSIVGSIDTNYELAQSLMNDANQANQGSTMMSIGGMQALLLDIKGEIQQGKTRILYNSRFYFLFLGFHALTMLVFCGHETFCSEAKAKGQFLGGLLFANLFFVGMYLLLTFANFQSKKGDQIVWKIASALLVEVVFIFIGCTASPISDRYTNAAEILAWLSIGALLPPFFLLLLRYERFERFIKINHFARSVKEINGKLLQAKAQIDNHTNPNLP